MANKRVADEIALKWARRGKIYGEFYFLILPQLCDPLDTAYITGTSLVLDEMTYKRIAPPITDLQIFRQQTKDAFYTAPSMASIAMKK